MTILIFVMRTLWLVCAALALAPPAWPQPVPQKSDWPAYGRDPGGTRYSPLDQIDTTNVKRLQRAWVYHTGEAGRAFEITPIVVGGVLYFATQNQKIVALEPETGREIWKFDPKSSAREIRGVTYWPGDRQTAARIFFGTSDGRLIALDARTGTLAKGFGDNGAVDLKAGITDKFPRASYAVTSPPTIYRNVVIVGPSTQEGPSLGPSGDPRAYDVRTGKLLWRFHTVPQPGEPGSETWGPDGWKDRSGPSQWGPATIDTERGLVFLPVGNPADSFYGADRKGTNLYANCVVALDALTGKLRWYYQTVHHDIWDYDLAAPPALVEVRRDGKTIPAVAQITKMGILFILDRANGRPVFGVAERPVPPSDTPGEQAWPTQPFPLKPPPLARMSMTKDEVTTRTPAAQKFCDEWFSRLHHEGAYTPFGTAPSLVFPGTMGGGNWGGVSFDPKLGYIFVNTSSLGGAGRMVKANEGAPMAWRNEGGYQRFIDPDGYPCQQPPWGELTAVNAEGDIAWRVPLGSYDELEAQGVQHTGAANMGGSIATAGGLVFIGATTDSKFRAFDSRTGSELWVTRLDATADTIPVTYQGRNGKQYVAIAAGGTNRFRMIAGTAGQVADSLIAFALPDGPAVPVREPTQAARPSVPNRLSEAELKGDGAPLPDGAGKEDVARMCSGCHGTAVFTRMRMGRQGWEDEVAAMVERGAVGSAQQVRAVTDYLVKNFGK
ncbi:MAG: pyrroloquinoline quinone-dependent dehydrogenase [Candidatus Sulfopaludibacter sp.]|nr:pyrroloquinoline quinone-dependent dehydrogenase [Candidatus Sulfopaludibacter sp.]